MTFAAAFQTFGAINSTIHVSEEIPLLPPNKGSSPPRFPNWIVSRETHLGRYARRMARGNRGRFRVELTDLEDRCLAFLQDLVVVPGLEGVQESGRYYLQVQIAHLFDPGEVSERVARVVRRHFYPFEEFVFGEQPIGCPTAGPVDDL